MKRFKPILKLSAAWAGCYLIAALMMWVCILKTLEVMAK